MSESHYPEGKPFDVYLTLNWPGKGGIDTYIHGKRTRLSEYIAAPGAYDCAVIDMDILRLTLERLVTKAIQKQKEYDDGALLAAKNIDIYLQNVGWYRPEALNPVTPVLPEKF